MSLNPAGEAVVNVQRGAFLQRDIALILAFHRRRCTFLRIDVITGTVIFINNDLITSQRDMAVVRLYVTVQDSIT